MTEKMRTITVGGFGTEFKVSFPESELGEGKKLVECPMCGQNTNFIEVSGLCPLCHEGIGDGELF